MVPAVSPEQEPDEVTVRFLNALKNSEFCGEIRADYAARLLGATDNSIYQVMPQAVVYPKVAHDLNVIAELGSRADFQGISFAPRGGGTGTNGQSLNQGVVVDTSKYLNQILSFDPVARQVTVQPGVVLDQLNSYLEERGFFFPPAVSTSSRATLGGMVGTDASGKGSRIYGKTSDYIDEMTVVLSDGQSWTSRPLSGRELQSVMQRDDLVGRVHRQVHHSITQNHDLIEKTFPRMNRGLTGYNLQQALGADGTFNLSYLLAGSEGSLCFTQQLILRVIEKPQHKGLVVVRYTGFNDALSGVQLLLQANPVAVEVVDDKIMTLAQDDIIWSQVSDMLGAEPGEMAPGSMNFVEFVGESRAAVEQQIKGLVTLLERVKGQDRQATGWRAVQAADRIAALWEMRKKSVGLLGALQGKRRAIAFVEDTAVPPENLPAFIGEFRNLLDSYGVAYGMFGHADVGCLHVRPTLDLTETMDEAKLRDISDAVATLTLKHGGLLWGEHGKGFRGEYSPQFFGLELYDELRQIKAAFDPDNLFNPGKIATPYTHPDATLTRIDQAPLRAHKDRQIRADLRIAYPKATLCNGNGACFTWDAFDPMCPSYKVTRDRLQSPKGRAGLLREWLRLQSLSESEMSQKQDFSHDVYAALKTCLSCKACASQCPVKVDIPEMKARFLESYHQRYSRPMRDHVVAHMEKLAPLSARFAHMVNVIQAIPLIQTMFRKRLGLIDLPQMSVESVALGLRKRGAPEFDLQAITALSAAEKERSVILLQDTYTTHYDAEVVLAHYDLLTELGYRVFVAPWRENGKPLHVKGFLKKFDQLARANDGWYHQLGQTGVPLVGVEAAVTLMFRQEYDQRLKDRPAYHVFQFSEWFHGQRQENAQSWPTLREAGHNYVLFAHCTEKTAIAETQKHWCDIFAAFGLSLTVQRTGCCGMAGMFGHEAENEEMSRDLYDMSWRAPVAQAGPDAMLATGFSCRCQTKRYGGFKPKHPVQALVALLGQGDFC